MWDQRYDADAYAYGTEANAFLREYYHHIPKGRVLSIGEGEGRNAVFLAKHGYDVTAVDGSEVGLKKALKLARENNVSINIECADLNDYDLGIERWDGIISIFVPLPSKLRRDVYRKTETALKPGGVFLVEAYKPDQVSFGTGGGSSPDTMQTAATLAAELPNLEFIYLTELERSVVEGSYHTGVGSVVQAVAIRR
jgi:2-polyprenyl-3-methyl-5-hydroxy-6-metoxy-1,4-benzoquinol methylase